MINLGLIIEYQVLGASSRTSLRSFPTMETRSRASTRMMEGKLEMRKDLKDSMLRREDPMGRNLRGTINLEVVEVEEECMEEEPGEDSEEEEAHL